MHSLGFIREAGIDDYLYFAATVAQKYNAAEARRLPRFKLYFELDNDKLLNTQLGRTIDKLALHDFDPGADDAALVLNNLYDKDMQKEFNDVVWQITTPAVITLETLARNLNSKVITELTATSSWFNNPPFATLTANPVDAGTILREVTGFSAIDIEGFSPSINALENMTANWASFAEKAEASDQKIKERAFSYFAPKPRFPGFFGFAMDDKISEQGPYYQAIRNEMRREQLGLPSAKELTLK